MASDNVTTGVDGLLELLRRKDHMPVSDAAKELGISEDTLMLWTEFLVEEKIIGIEYKFTKPYIYLNKPREDDKTKIVNEQKISLATFREELLERAAKSNIPAEQHQQFWEQHLFNELEHEKDFFVREARKRGFHDPEKAWQDYREDLLQRCGPETTGKT